MVYKANCFFFLFLTYSLIHLNTLKRSDRKFSLNYTLFRQGMSTAVLVTFVRHGGSQVRGALLKSRIISACHCSSVSRRSFSSRFDPDSSGRPATWDSFGIWDNRIDEPIQLPPSIKYGKLIPHINLSKVGCSTQLGKRKENEDQFDYAKLTDNVLYFAVYDGHGGAGAADFCNRFMTQYIK